MTGLSNQVSPSNSSKSLGKTATNKASTEHPGGVVIQLLETHSWGTFWPAECYLFAFFCPEHLQQGGQQLNSAVIEESLCWLLHLQPHRPLMPLGLSAVRGQYNNPHSPPSCHPALYRLYLTHHIHPSCLFEPKRLPHSLSPSHPLIDASDRPHQASKLCQILQHVSLRRDVDTNEDGGRDHLSRATSDRHKEMLSKCTRLESGENFFTEWSSIGCPGKWWCPQPWRYSRDVPMKDME